MIDQPCSTKSECDSAAMADAMAHVTQVYIAGLLILGFFGNTYCVTAFLMPDYRRVPSSLYLSALALSDIGFLLTLGLLWMRSIGLRFLDMSHVTCTICMFTSYFCCFMSGWLVLSITWERYLIARGMISRETTDIQTRRNWYTYVWKKCATHRNIHHNRVRITFVCILIFGLLINSWVLFAADTISTWPKSGSIDNFTRSIFESDTKLMVCDVSQGEAGNLYPTFNALDMIFSFTLPFLGVIVLNMKIGYMVCRARDLARRNARDMEGRSIRSDNQEMALQNLRPESITGDQKAINRDPNIIEGDRPSISENSWSLEPPMVTPVGQRRTLRLAKIEKRVTKLLVTISLAYLILNLPSYILRIIFAFEHPPWSSSADDDSVEDDEPFKTPGEIIVETVSYLMFYTQFSINFFLYSCHGCMFSFMC